MGISIKDKELLKKVVKLNKKMGEKYGYLVDKWWKVPEENSVYALASMQIHTGMAAVFSLGASASILGAVLSFTGDSKGLALGIGFVAGLLTISGFVQFSKSNKYKKIYEEEKRKLAEAERSHPVIYQKLKEVTERANRQLSLQLAFGMDKAETFKDFSFFLNSMAVTTNQAKEELQHLYQTTKTYEYNLYEAMEIEAFKEVDNYIAFEEESNHLHQIFELISEAKTMADDQKESDFRHAIERLSEKLED